jgi:nickel-dependent lactate racemase
MIYYNEGSCDKCMDEAGLENILREVVGKIYEKRKIERVLILPPDFTRFHSRAGLISTLLYKILGDKVKMILPALGTHFAMSTAQKTEMFKNIPLNLIKDHDHKKDVIELGRISSEEMLEISGGIVDYDWPVQVNRTLVEDGWDLIISVGQVVPHEVAGMSNYTKNTLVGTGGKECIDKSHYVGALCDTERIMGQISNPVRELLNRGSDRYLKDLPILYIHTVVSPDMKGGNDLKGLFIGDDAECFINAARLAQKANIFLLDRRPAKMIVYLDPDEYQSTWVGCKGIYRSRLAVADGGEIVIIAPGLHCFGENSDADKLIRKFGYKGTPYISRSVKEDDDLASNLGTAAHLIHGSTEGRFKVTICPGKLSKDEIETVGHCYGNIDEYIAKYNPSKLNDGWNNLDGEEFYYISNPGLGLWSHKDKFISR